MKDYLNYINDNYPTRRNEAQKKDFRNYIDSEISNQGYEVKIEKLENKHNNILIGDVDNAKIVFCAHYDTPAASLFPNIMMPRNPVLSMCYQFSYPILLASIALGVAFGMRGILSLSMQVTVIIYLVLYFSLFYFCTRCFNNKHNKNDNTSGVATILELINKNKCNEIAYILFDNEEKGKLGSKAFSKAHKNYFFNKLVINLDCVGNGENFLFVAKDKALKTKEYAVIEKVIKSNDKYKVFFYPMKGSMSNSDYKNFECGVSVMACKKNSKIGFYTPKIHTSFDTEASNDNIEFITTMLFDFIFYLKVFVWGKKVYINDANDLPSSFWTLVDKWKELAKKEVSDGPSLWYAKNASTTFELNGITYVINPWDIFEDDIESPQKHAYFESLQGTIRRDLEAIGAKNIQNFGMLD